MEVPDDFDIEDREEIYFDQVFIDESYSRQLEELKTQLEDQNDRIQAILKILLKYSFLTEKNV
jgi:hypothetical protein